MPPQPVVAARLFLPDSTQVSPGGRGRPFSLTSCRVGWSAKRTVIEIEGGALECRPLR
jgi:hypothetical protein